MSTKVTPEKANACFVVLMRNSDVQDFRKTMQQLEDRFNKNFNYPYVFLNEVPFTEEVKTYLKAQTKAKVEFGLIPKEHWEIPRFLNESTVLEAIKEQKEKDQVPYGGKLSYHHMCR
ncbi:glycosyl transferase [Neoconidiobolus thromboides FSU 785]|nr:glycosyl transferase [Neoconidiobolus thromboides FSU 785]